jgi:CheY-like chemotaxis protein
MVKVLVVDDEEPIRETLRDLLEDEGYDVEEAADGREALAALERSIAPCVVLLDLVMPHMDGLEVLRRVAADAALARRHAYLVLTARHNVAGTEARALLDAVGAPVIEKPFDIEALAEAVLLASLRAVPQAAPGVPWMHGRAFG